MTVKPFVSNAMNSRCQVVDLIDMQSQPDEQYKFILNYQDHLTKFCVLKPLKSKRAEESHSNLWTLFCLLGSPHVIQYISIVCYVCCQQYTHLFVIIIMIYKLAGIILPPPIKRSVMMLFGRISTLHFARRRPICS